ncbi:hypothetical protein [Paenibacillus mesotrionivorans]|uniref:Uncharacterized protein n=1 Tax=Paenibacillus mesotrionivorans TaxID=3160968 RepID=A0ACC7P4F6_9BACL
MFRHAVPLRSEGERRWGAEGRDDLDVESGDGELEDAMIWMWRAGRHEEIRKRADGGWFPSG